MARPEIGLAQPPWIVGHRGAAGEAPENTLDSLLLAVDQAADMVEFDLQLSADDRLVACHDWTLERMGDSALQVEESRFELLAAAEVSGPFRQAGRHRTLATLPQILGALPATMPLNIELKRRAADPSRLAERLAAVVGDRPQLLVSSFDWALLESVRRTLPRVALAPIGGRQADPAALLAAADALGAWSVHCRHSVATPDFVAAAGALPILAYTVNEPETARRLFDRGVRGVFTDYPGRLRAELETRR